MNTATLPETRSAQRAKARELANHLATSMDLDRKLAQGIRLDRASRARAYITALEDADRSARARAFGQAIEASIVGASIALSIGATSIHFEYATPFGCAVAASLIPFGVAARRVWGRRKSAG